MYELVQEKAEDLIHLHQTLIFYFIVFQMREKQTLFIRDVLLVQFGKDPDHVPLAVHCLTDDPESMYPSMHE